MYEQVKLTGRCPDCGGVEYWKGPSGGGADNICCSICFSAFCILPGWAERIPNTFWQKHIEDKKPKIGDKITIKAVGTITEVHDSHGLCYRVELERKKFVSPRTIWVDPDEIEKQ